MAMANYGRAKELGLPMGTPCSIVLLLIRTMHEWLGYEVLSADKVWGDSPGAECGS